MIKAIKLFLLKRKIGYRKVDNNKCWTCFAFECGYCARFHFNASSIGTCNHFVPKNYNQTVSEKERVSIENIISSLNKMIDIIGGKYEKK